MVQLLVVHMAPEWIVGESLPNIISKIQWVFARSTLLSCVSCGWDYVESSSIYAHRCESGFIFIYRENRWTRLTRRSLQLDELPNAHFIKIEKVVSTASLSAPHQTFYFRRLNYSLAHFWRCSTTRSPMRKLNFKWIFIGKKWNGKFLELTSIQFGKRSFVRSLATGTRIILVAGASSSG